MKPIMAIILFAAIAILPACDQSVEASPVVESGHPIEGAWDLQAMSIVTSEGSQPLSNLRPERILFTEGHYAIVGVQAQRQPFADPQNPTPEEIIAAYQAVSFNSGVYSKNENTITVVAQAAREPLFQGSQRLFSYEIDEDVLTMVLTDMAFANGQKPGWVGNRQTAYRYKKATK